MRLSSVIVGLGLLVASASLAHADYAPPPPPGPMGPPGAAPYAAPPAAPGARTGATVELNIGLGVLHASADGGNSDTETGLAGINLGIGGWAAPNLAISGRIAGVVIFPEGGQIVAGFVGPSLQYWIDNNLWIGGGAGLSITQLKADSGETASENAFGLNLRAGYTFTSNTLSTFNISVEATPGFYEGGTITGIGFLVGWQRL
jgi:hypothetical protein